MRVVFNIAIIIVAVVAVIIMMNTLVISVIERTGEIGTMRALGAKKGFVRRMFLVETLTIAVVFGLIGTALAFGVVGIIDLAHITATNAFLKILFAGQRAPSVRQPGLGDLEPRPRRPRGRRRPPLPGLPRAQGPARARHADRIGG